MDLSIIVPIFAKRKIEYMNIFDNRFQAYLRVSGRLSEYVYLREDENGRYIEYAFRDGAPHDNRCLDWYAKSHPTYSERHGGWETPEMSYGLKPLDKIYRLSAFDCGRSDREDPNERCTPGCPWKGCDWAKGWLYEEPVKCACWHLSKIDEDNMDFNLRADQIDDYLRILNELNNKEN